MFSENYDSDGFREDSCSLEKNSLTISQETMLLMMFYSYQGAGGIL